MGFDIAAGRRSRPAGFSLAMNETGSLCPTGAGGLCSAGIEEAYVGFIQK